MQLGREIGRGLRSVVYAYGACDAVKVPNADVPRRWVVEEHRLTEAVARSGVAVPGRRRLLDVHGTTALVSERIFGPSMWQHLVAQPASAADLGAELAGVQAGIAARPVSFELPSQRDRIVSKVHLAARAHGRGLARVLDVLPGDVGPLVICHGDLHPRNVLASDDANVLVDWFDASRGRVEGEIARTVLVLEDSEELGLPDDAGLKRAWEELLRSYTSAACAAAGLEEDDLAPWLLAQRVARLAEGFGAHRLDELRRRLDLS